MSAEEQEPEQDQNTDLTEDDIKKMKVAELKDALAERELATDGKKADLAARLLEFVNSQSQDNATPSEEEATPMEEEATPMEEAAPIEEEAAPIEEEAAPMEEEAATIEEEAAPEEEEAAPKEEETAPEEEEAAPKEEETASKEEETVSMEDDTPLKKEEEVDAPAPETSETSETETTITYNPEEPVDSKEEEEEEKGKPLLQHPMLPLPKPKKKPKVKKAPPPANPNSKRAKKKAKQRAAQLKLQQEEGYICLKIAEAKRLAEKNNDEEEEIELVSEEIMTEENPAFEEFQAVFSKFAKAEQLSTAARKQREAEEQKQEKEEEAKENGDTAAATKDDDADDDDNDGKLSNKERKRRSRLSIAELKQLVSNPEMVEFHDCNSSDPKLLVHLKSYRNAIPVPTHWGAKRKFLQNKRAIEREPFKLPDFITATGITDIRSAQQEKDATASAKQTARARTAPKTGKLDIDYQVLHDAFFRYQTKPIMTRHGCLYYEGREIEARLKAKRPGQLSDELKRALGMVDETSPPPWLFKLQQFGPPPAYPNLKIPGVNHPIPSGARYGRGPREWGRAPVDDYGRPLYGDVFGTEQKEDDDEDLDCDKELWGAIISDDEEDEDDEEEEEDDEDEDDDEDMESGLESLSSATSGLETPETLQLRKVDADTSGSTNEAPPKLYQVLEETKTSIGGAIFGSTHGYNITPQADINTDATDDPSKKAKKIGDQVAVALNPDELENLDAVTLKRKYEAQLEEQKLSKANDREDMSDLIAEHQAKKRKAAAKKGGEGKKFKF